MINHRSYIEKAQDAYGEMLPDWISRLAKEADQIGAYKAARKVDIKRPTLSLIIRNKYSSSKDKVEAAVRTQLMQLECALVGEIITYKSCQEKSAKQFNFMTCRNCVNYQGVENEYKD